MLNLTLVLSNIFLDCSLHHISIRYDNWLPARAEAGWPHTLFILYKNNANPKKLRTFAVEKKV